MKAYKITGKLGDICSFVGGNEVKKGDTVYFHSESDMKHQCVAKTQENDMSIEAMKLALEALDRCGSENYSLEREAIESLRQAIEQASSVSSIQSDKTSDAEKQEPYGWVSQHTVKGPYEWQFNKELSGVYRDNAISILPVYTTPQPQREWVGLTPDDFRQLEKENTVCGLQGDYCPTWDLIEATEAKLKEKNSAT